VTRRPGQTATIGGRIVTAIGALALLSGACGGGSRGAPVAAVGRYASVRGIRMYYEIHGSGPPLVLLHGGAGNGMQFEKQIPDFSKHYTCIVPDMCEQGRSTGRPGPLTYHEMAEDVIALADRLHLKRFDVMGWSDGGVTGIDIAIHHSDRLAHLVTFGANFRPDGLNAPDVAWNDTATVSAFGDDMRIGYQKLSPQPDHYADAMTKILFMWKTMPMFTPAELGGIHVPAMICAGDHDLIRRDHTEALVAAIPGAVMWIVPNASHGAMIERPELVNPRVLEFLAK
jgi:pimeloyl-ACP methyl ester carboxylesterase